MQAHIYRFEIVRALANAVYQVKDPASGDLLTLYEWTPAVADREPAKSRLGELQDHLKCEVFTADASLYFVAISRDQARDVLGTLHSHHLFLDCWPDGVPPRVDTPAPAKNEPITKLPAQVRATYAAAAVLLVGAVMLSAGYVMGKGAEAEPAKTVAIQDSHSSSDRELLQSRRREKELQKHAAADAERITEFAGIKTLRIRNSGPLDYQVAVSFRSFNGLMVVQGWTRIAPGKTQIVGVSPSDRFLVYAKRKDGAVVPGSEEPISVEDGDFVYYDGDATQGMTVVRPALASAGTVEVR